MSIKNSNDNIGNRTRNLPACRAVPQPTATPRAPLTEYTHTHTHIYIYIYIYIIFIIAFQTQLDVLY